MARLSKRMEAVAAMVCFCGVLADVGTDHGYVPIALVERKKIKRAIAMDINRGPLERAGRNIAASGMEAHIETRLSDGVEALAENEADSILIAGMGGELILQPQSDIRRVREYLRLHRYKIVDEDMVCEDGKYYPMLRAVNAAHDDARTGMDEETAIVCDIYGPLLLKNGHPVLKRFLAERHRLLDQIMDQLKEQPNSRAIADRMQEIQEEIRYNESAHTILEGIKNAGI